ncbi:multidrug resistance-associated protein 5-like isoform X2 [Anneissia japonica]|uniref:multidrug resistance-associated protein 5-like isoform X2 n=1 Tax=Anneissia japonica TaxID=1529436 RepID=UPI0014255E90|nr:multidrug resistance-associated protein 5-like isoform X2 [Anneissia japonica]
MNRGRYARDTMGNRRCIFPMLSKMTNLLQKARKKTLSNQDLEEYSLGKDYARKDASRLETLWKQACFQQVEGASFLHACFLFIRRQFIFSCILSTFAEIVGRIGGVMVICETLKYVEKQDWDVHKGLMLTFLLVAVVVIRVFVLNNVLYANSKVAVRLRTAILILFYKHISKMKSTVVSVGEVVNILTNDGARIYDAVLNCHVICRTMLVLLAVLTFIIRLIGVTALGGVLALLTVIISQSIAAKILTKQRSKYSKISAERVKIMNEILTYAKLIKMYVWEKSFAAKIKEIRKRELNQLEKVNFLHGLTLTFVYAANPSAMVTIMLTIVFTGREISVPELFGLLVCFTTLANIVHSLPIVLKPTVEALVAIKRIQKILQIQDQPFTYEVPQKSENAVEVSNASFSWRMSELDGSNVIGYGHIDAVADSVVSPDVNEESMLNSRNQHSDKLVLCDMNIEIPKSSLVGICGAIGSGKTSFLNALLGQLPMVSGRVAVAGRFSYVPQQAWIMNATVRENIIFNEDFDPVRYAEIIEACSLTEDLAVLEQGDNTEIGERGINLSGGQKQRVNLARALYSGGDIFLLDDPLSAVDAHVGKHIFHRCIRELMKDKTVIFVTHHLQYLQYCDDIYLLRSGRIYENGSHNVLMEKDTEYRTLIKTHYNKNLKTPTKEEEHSINHDTLTKQPDEQKYDDTIKSNNMDIPAESGKLIRKEDAGIGAGKFSYLWKYIKYTGGVPTLIVFIFLSIFASSTTLAVNLTLTLWIDAGAGSFNTSGTDYHSNDIRLNPDFPKYVTAYALVFVAIFVFGTASTFFNIKIFRKASGRIHNKMFNKLILAKMQFFDTTPIGRILNRFSKDMDDSK